MYCKNFFEKKFVDVLLTLASNFSSCYHPISFSFMTRIHHVFVHYILHRKETCVRITAKISTAVFSLAFSKVALR